MRTNQGEPPHGCAGVLMFGFACFVIAIMLLLTSCSTIKEVPVETIKTKIEYRDRILYDSIYTHDSIYIRAVNDTVYQDRYKYVYKYKMLKDTVQIECIDSIPYTVKVPIEVNKLNLFQKFSLWGFWIMVACIGLYTIFKIKRFII